MTELERFEAWFKTSGFWNNVITWKAWQAALESRVLAESSNKADEEWCKAYAEEWQDTLKEQSDRIKELERVLAERASLTEREVIAISNALQGSNYAYLGDRLRAFTHPTTDDASNDYASFHMTPGQAAKEQQGG
jgi:hypothetical protein